MNAPKTLNKAVFLDKDGTINEEANHLSHYKDLKLLPHSAEAIRLLNEAGYKVIVISNQAGIARGLFSEDMLQAIDKTLQKELLNRGAFVNAIYYCPHHPEHGCYPYRQVCTCRKPHTGLVERAAKEYNIDLKSSFFVGDHANDVKTGRNAQMKTVFVMTGHGKEEFEEVQKNGKPDHVAQDLLEAVKWILKK
jgi:D-glycero-D-manno-heptose 1,7-bisphosphate phosphatase